MKYNINIIKSVRAPGLLAPPDDVQSRKTVVEFRNQGIPCRITNPWPKRWETVLRYSNRFTTKIIKTAAKVFVDREICRKIHQNDIVWSVGSVIPHEISTKVEEKIISKSSGYIFHFLDNYFAVKESMAYKIMINRLRIADLVVVSSEKLKSLTLGYYPNLKIEVFHDPVDFDRISINNRYSCASELPVIVWSGNPFNLKELPFLTNILEKIYSENKFVFRVISGWKKPSLNFPFPWEWFPFNYLEEGRLYSNAICGLAPVSDSYYARYKSSYKVKIYMTCGLPTIASPVGYQSELLKDGITGFLVKSEKEWLDAMYYVLTNKDSALEMGANARIIGESIFSHKAVISKWPDKLQKHF